MPFCVPNKVIKNIKNMKIHSLLFCLGFICVNTSIDAKDFNLEKIALFVSNKPIEVTKSKTKLIYLDQERLAKVKRLIAQKDSFFTEAYQQLITEANLELEKKTDPVTNKTQLPASGNKHDYLSIAPYRWPNPATATGFPWILKDGQINPMTTGSDTDHSRLNNLFNSLDQLAMAYYFSDESKYANKLKTILNVWFINKDTKVNPNVNHGQAVPGEVDGRRAGMITWSRFATVITAIQILDAKKLVSKKEMKQFNLWISDYYTWLKTSKMGVENDNGNQNHSTNYDYQMVGIARYLGLNDEAKSRVEAAKSKRIAVQIDPEGKQPFELGRTKSVHYCSMNLRIMTFVAEIGRPLGVDLWNFSTPDSRSMKKAFDYLRPFAEGTKEWTHKQITEGGIDKAVQLELLPLFSIASTVLNQELIDEKTEAYKNLAYMDKLKYPPLFKIK